MAIPEDAMDFTAGVSIRPTGPEDLPGLMALWNDGVVMRGVGFPEGLGYDAEDMAAWWRALAADPDRHHSVVRSGEGDFCGEACYRVERRARRAALDIKLCSWAQGLGVATIALGMPVGVVSADEPGVDAVWVEPSPANLAARRLYERCGLRPRPRPEDLPPGDSYWELRRDREAADGTG
ncbi:MAG: GNAT family N-acetyltransferase [Acidimicrobiia bacterium]|nr:GNAT family N-acetyltransferase [Acidimicrobiia bacterium]